MAKKSSKFTQKITHVDDMIIHNLVKYLVQTRLRLWDIKITNFKSESCPNDLLEICYFYISQKKSSLEKIFYKIVYHHIIYMCDFFGEFRWLFFLWFARVFTKVVVSTRYGPAKKIVCWYIEGTIVSDGGSSRYKISPLSTGWATNQY